MAERLIHCSYHKCMTQYFAGVMRQLLNNPANQEKRYKHFKSFIDDFYRESDGYLVSSVNNHALDLERLGSFRVSRFIRDPRDLVVSGYFYHRRGAEYWCDIPQPTLRDWKVVNGNVPSTMIKGESFSKFLQRLSIEDGLMAEIDFRKFHFESMLRWPDYDPRILVFRYEDLIENEVEVFREIFNFLGLSASDQVSGLKFAQKLAARNVAGATDHIRDPQPAQWKKYFTAKVEAYFTDRYENILQRYQYL